MIVFPNAKINIGLNVVADRPDGYHDLETVFYPIPVQESLECVLSDTSEQVSFSAHGIPVAGNLDSNLVVRAARILKDNGYDFPPIHLVLDKQIPMGAGIGGGSADAAYTLMMLNEMFSLGLTRQQLIDFAAKLGADCPFFIVNKPVFATGIGEVMSPVNVDLGGYFFVLVRPDIFVSTKQAFSGIVSRRPQHSLQDLIKLPIEQWQGLVHNDFEDSIFPAFPGIAQVKDKLLDAGAIYSSMSGSGSSVFGIFKKQPDVDLKSLFDGCFFFQTVLPHMA